MSLPKPVMRSLLARRFKLLLPIGMAGSIAVVIAFKTLVVDPRKKLYDKFYKEYDSVKEFNAMREAGVFESVQPTGK